jgi:hypothetical protein
MNKKKDLLITEVNDHVDGSGNSISEIAEMQFDGEIREIELEDMKKNLSKENKNNGKNN